MSPTIPTTRFGYKSISSHSFYLIAPFIAGLFLPVGFAPFHQPGIALIGVALLFVILYKTPTKQALLMGFMFGLGYTGLGVSWVYNSIHEYGHLPILSSAIITLCFIAYLSLFLAVMSMLYKLLSQNVSLGYSGLLFSALWCLFEWLRSTLMGGFPWLLLGFSQMDTPIQHLLPIFGVYGASFVACLAATYLGASFLTHGLTSSLYLILVVVMLLSPLTLQNKIWGSTATGDPISVGIIQANLSMREKWDETLFWRLLQHYQKTSEELIKTNQLVVMPESAIPVPVSYISDFIEELDEHAQYNKSAILLGTLIPVDADENQLYNAMISLGHANGQYLKQHLVPFGEFIPRPFQKIMEWLAIPLVNIYHGKANQPLIQIHNHPVASLICYELAYPHLVRKQLPNAHWIVSISDDGWFGHSFALHQQLQMAQVISKQTGRFHIMANNDGLSSVINAQGQLQASLPAFEEGILKSYLQPRVGSTPWIQFGDCPVLWLCLFILSIQIIATLKRYTRH